MKAIHVPSSGRMFEPTRHGAHIMKEVVVRGGQIPNMTQIAFATLPEGPAEVEPHRHPTMWECYLVVEGTAIYSVDGDEVLMKPGDFLAIPPNTLHNQTVTHAPHRIFYWGIAVSDS